MSFYKAINKCVNGQWECSICENLFAIDHSQFTKKLIRITKRTSE